MTTVSKLGRIGLALVAAAGLSLAQDTQEKQNPQPQADRPHHHRQQASGTQTGTQPAVDPSHRRWNNSGFPQFLFDLAEKPAAEREKILQADAHFRSLPAERQQHVRDRIQHISEMTPDQRKKLRERYEVFHQLSPETREKVRSQIYPAWHALPDDRRKAMRAEFRELQKMAPADREKRFAQDSFTKQYTSDEQKLLKDTLSTLAPPEETAAAKKPPKQ